MAGPIKTLSEELHDELRAGRWNEAIAVYERELLPEERSASEFRIPYAIALVRAGRVSSGMKILESEAEAAADAREDIRRWLVKPLLDDGQTSRAMAVLDVLIAGNPESVLDLRLRASLYGRQKKWDEAIADVETILEVEPEEPIGNAQYLSLLLQSGRVEEAGAHAEKVVDFASTNGRLAHATLTALNRSGRHSESAILAGEVAESEVLDPALAATVVDTLLHSGRTERAIETGERLLREGFESATLRRALGEAHLASDADDKFEKAIAHLEKGLELEPSDWRMNSTLGEALLRKGAYEDATRYLAAACEAQPKAAQTRALYARALKQCRRFADAAAEFRRLLVLQPSSDRWKRYAAGALSQAGQHDQARRIFDSFVAERRASLPNDFEAGLDALWGKVDDAVIPQGRLDWGWQLRRHELTNDREEWERRAKWGHLADHYLLDWLECRDDRIHEPMSRLADLEDAERVLAGVDRSKGLILASGHIGPMYAGPLALELLGVPARWLASTPSVARTAYAKSLISTSDQEDMQIAQAFMRAIRRKLAVVIAVDGAINLAAPRIKFEGQEITYSSFAARTAHRMGVPSLFAQPFWKEGKISFMLRKLPDPEVTRNPDTYAELWREAFLEHLRDYLGGAPENLRLSGGIWRHVR